MQPNRNLNDWLSYSIAPGDLNTILRPAMWGNGQLELYADLDRPCVSEVVCFGYGQEALWYGPGTGRYGGDQHLVPAVYDAESGRKYFLFSTASSDAQDATVVFRPDRQVWHYKFDDLTIDLSLILPLKAIVEGEPVSAYFARAFGDTIPNARENLAPLLASPEMLETETEAWWGQGFPSGPGIDRRRKRGRHDRW
jgi:hypothetical protein